MLGHGIPAGGVPMLKLFDMGMGMKYGVYP